MARTKFKKDELLSMLESGDARVLSNVNVFKDLIEACIKIQPFGQTEFKLITLNNTQEKFVDEYFKQAQFGPVRIIVLKGRRCGLSTILAAICVIEMLCRPGLRAAIVAPKKESTAEPIYKQLYRKMMEGLEIDPTVNDFIREGDGLRLTQNQSNLRVDFESKIIGIALDFMHITEAAYFKNLHDFLSHAIHTIAPESRSSITIESTANAYGDVYHEQWLKAEKGDSNFEPMFFSWFDHELNTKEFISPKQKLEFVQNIKPGVQGTWGDEVSLIALDVTPEQLNWRRAKIKDVTLGVFHREYPSTPEEAFLQSDSNVFDVRALKWQIKNHELPPVAVGDFEIMGMRHNEVAPMLTPCYPGFVHIWEQPDPEMEYVIGVDVSEGKQDFSVGSVLSRRPLELVATLRGYDTNNLEPLMFADQLYHLGKYYHSAPMAIENNSSGLSVINHLQNLGYYDLLGMEELFPNFTAGSRDQLGWRNTTQTRQSAIEAMKYAIRNKMLIIHDNATLIEMVNFIYVGLTEGNRVKPQAARKGEYRKPGAEESGYYDDRLFALMGAYLGHQSLGFARSPRDIRMERGMHDHNLLEMNRETQENEEFDLYAMDYDPFAIPMAHLRQ